MNKNKTIKCDNCNFTSTEKKFFRENKNCVLCLNCFKKNKTLYKQLTLF